MQIGKALELELGLEGRPFVSVSAVSTPALIPYGPSWALVFPSVKWAPEIGPDECEGHLRLVCFEEGGAGLEGLALGSFVAQE